jgi:hypothetical protein
LLTPHFNARILKDYGKRLAKTKKKVFSNRAKIKKKNSRE